MMKKLFIILALILGGIELGVLGLRFVPQARADIAADDSRDVYTGNGTTTSFTYNFKILTSANIAVYQAATLKTLTTHYTLTGVNNDAGGTVVFVTAPANGEQVLLLRAQPINQNSQYIDGSISASTIERDFDRQTSINQQQQEEINRGLKYPRTITPTTTLTELPAPVAEKCIGYNVDATALALNNCGGSGGGTSFTTSAGLAGALSDETGTGLAVFNDSPTFTTKYTLGTCAVLTGSGSPEGAVTAPVCSLYFRTDGGASTTLYAKESGAGNTGWVPHGNPAGSGAPTTVPFITSVADGGVSNEFALGSLATGILRNTTTTGIPTIATACTHYLDTTCVLTNGQLPITISGRIFDNTNLYGPRDSLWVLQDDGDSTKQMAFQLAAYTTGTTFTLTPPAANTHLLGGSHFAGTHTGRMLRTGTATYAVCRDNFAGTTSPGVTDDSAANYCVGSLWVNTTASPRTVWTASNVTAGGAVWVQSGVSSTPGLQAVSDVGRAITNASSFATGVHIGLSATSGERAYEDVTLGFIRACVVAGVENACNYIRKIAAGFIFELQDSTGTPKFTFTSDTGALTNVTLNAESSGNILTIPYEDTFEFAACNNAIASLVLNSNTVNAPAPACEGTNTRIATADFDDTTDEGQDFRWRLPTGFTGAIDWIIRWKAVATSGAVGWCVQMVRIPTGATSDPALPAQAAGNCTSTTVAGTTLQEVESTLTNVTCTSCVAGDAVNVRISRDANGGAVTDSMTGDAKGITATRRYRRAL